MVIRYSVNITLISSDPSMQTVNRELKRRQRRRQRKRQKKQNFQLYTSTGYAFCWLLCCRSSVVCLTVIFIKKTVVGDKCVNLEVSVICLVWSSMWVYSLKKAGVGEWYMNSIISGHRWSNVLRQCNPLKGFLSDRRVNTIVNHLLVWKIHASVDISILWSPLSNLQKK